MPKIFSSSLLKTKILANISKRILIIPFDFPNKKDNSINHN